MENSKEEEQMICFRCGRNSRNMRNLSEPRPERPSLSETAFSFHYSPNRKSPYDIHRKGLISMEPIVRFELTTY